MVSTEQYLSGSMEKMSDHHPCKLYIYKKKSNIAFLFVFSGLRSEKRRDKITPPPGADLNPVLLEGNRHSMNGSDI